jgi:hypothetical protein
MPVERRVQLQQLRQVSVDNTQRTVPDYYKIKVAEHESGSE